MSLTDLKKALKEKTLTIGTERTMTKLKTGKLKKVFIAKNCPKEVKEELKHFCKLSKTDLIELSIPNDEVGAVCKKPFSISVISY